MKHLKLQDEFQCAIGLMGKESPDGHPGEKSGRHNRHGAQKTDSYSVGLDHLLKDLDIEPWVIEHACSGLLHGRKGSKNKSQDR